MPPYDQELDNPDVLTEDKVIVHEGDRVFNYYDHKVGTIVPKSFCHAPDLWFDVLHEDGTKSVLNGARICSIDFAIHKGWIDA